MLRDSGCPLGQSKFRLGGSAALRVFSAVGPGDIVNAYRDWAARVRTVSETSLTFSGQLLDYLSDNGISHWLVSSHTDQRILRVGDSVIENRPKKMTAGSSGWRYHWAQVRYAVSLAMSAIKFRATHAIIDSGTTHWFALALLRVAGIIVIANFHNIYWPAGHPPRRLVPRLVMGLDRVAFRYFIRAATGVSGEIGSQVSCLSSGRCRFVEYRAQFHAADFEHFRPVEQLGPRVTILYAGRVEANKGALDLVEICTALLERFHVDVIMEVCGGGSALEALKARVELKRLESRFLIHGKLLRDQLLLAYQRASFVVVPTRSDIGEGLPMVCAEAVLAGRPVVTSRLSNALEALRGAVIEARADDPEDYARAIAECVKTDGAYETVARATASVRGQFLDPGRGYANAVAQAIACCKP
jgi:glycogen synthase